MMIASEIKDSSEKRVDEDDSDDENESFDSQ